jgi:hypothetical protein
LLDPLPDPRRSLGATNMIDGITPPAWGQSSKE